MKYEEKTLHQNSLFSPRMALNWPLLKPIRLLRQANYNGKLNPQEQVFFLLFKNVKQYLISHAYSHASWTLWKGIAGEEITCQSLTETSQQHSIRVRLYNSHMAEWEVELKWVEFRER